MDYEGQFRRVVKMSNKLRLWFIPEPFINIENLAKVIKKTIEYLIM